jgi:two-component system NtrC family sensor kinase
MGHSDVSGSIESMSAPSRPSTSAESGASVLVVEDQRLVAADLAMQLRGFGFRVVGFAVSGQEAVAKARELAPDVVLMDINLEGAMDGTEAARQIREHSRCAIVFLTAFSDLQTLERAKLAEPGGYVVKPASPAELRCALEVALHKQRSEGERVAAEARQFGEQLAQVQRRVGELENAYLELESCSASLAHDLRNPLQVIAGATEMIERTQSDQLNPLGRVFLAQVAAAAERMMTSLNGLLQAARENRGELSRSEFDLGALAEEVCQEMRNAAPHVQCEVARGLTVYADRNLVRRVLENLFSNALKFSSGVAQPRIELGVLRAAGDAQFYVRDNGVGFSMSVAEGKLFRPYGRLHDAGVFGGTGLGLAGARKIIERHGGTMWAESKEGEGATFYFTLP